MSWLKKNELDIKRHMSELRDNVRNNWTTTGQELGRELKQFWQPVLSRSASPARPLMHMTESREGSTATSPTSPSALAHLSHLEAPRSSASNGTGSSDFAAGYSLGLIGGIRSWVSYRLPGLAFKSALTCANRWHAVDVH